MVTAGYASSLSSAPKTTECDGTLYYLQWAFNQAQVSQRARFKDSWGSSQDSNSDCTRPEIWKNPKCQGRDWLEDMKSLLPIVLLSVSGISLTSVITGFRKRKQWSESVSNSSTNFLWAFLNAWLFLSSTTRPLSSLSLLLSFFFLGSLRFLAGLGLLASGLLSSKLKHIAKH